jgi:GT2 family glycosyltransferase
MMMSHTAIPDLSVIIVSWNTRDLLLACLHALPAACEGLAWDAIVIDNASTDGSIEAIRTALPQVRVIENAGNVGFARANNQGMAASQARFYLLLNSDTLPEPGSLTRLLRHAETQPGLGLIGPRLLNPDGSFQPSCWALPSLLSELLSATGLGERVVRSGYPGFAERDCQHDKSVGCISGAAMLARREAVQQVGGMSEKLFMYGEEPDWCWRMAAAGWGVGHHPAARVVHYGGQSTRQVRAEMLRALYRSKITVLSRYRSHTQGQILRLAVTLVWWLKWQLVRPVSPEPTIRWRDLESTF